MEKESVESWERYIFQIHSTVRDIDGLNPIEAVSEISNLLILKIIFERLDINCKGMLPEEIRKRFKDEIAVLDNQISDSISLTDLCLSNVWGILECKELTKSGGDLLGRAIQKTISPNARSGMGQYFTPTQVIKFMIEVIQPKSDFLIIDPFHGSGEFLMQAYNYCLEKEGNKSQNLFGIEKNPLVHKLSLLKSMLYSSEPKLILGDGFAEIFTLPNKGIAAFDAVLTNPPFGSKLQTENILSPNDYSIIENRKSINTETLAVERSLNLLKEGGKFGIIVPDSFLGNRNHSRIRSLISEKMDLRLVVSLPIETFTPFGANVKSSIIFGKKQINRKHDADNTHLIQINHVGYDSVGRITEKNDFKQALRQIGENLWR